LPADGGFVKTHAANASLRIDREMPMLKISATAALPLRAGNDLQYLTDSSHLKLHRIDPRQRMRTRI